MPDDFFRADQSFVMTAKNAEAAPVCCRFNSFVLVCGCFFLSPLSAVADLARIKTLKRPGSCGARVKTSERHD